MPLPIQKDRISLNNNTHSVRASQSVLQYGVGAMVDFPDQTLMTAAPEYWQTQIEKVHDERLEKILHVDYFGMPGGYSNKETQQGISYTRFPEWYFCPKCRRFQPLKKWIKDFRSATNMKKKVDADPFMVKHMKCPKCNYELVVSRFMVICEHGHIDDFPWVKWVHSQNKKPICSNPILSYKSAPGSAEGLEGTEIWCETCQIKTTLKKAYLKDFSEGKYDNIFQHIDLKTNGQYDYRCTGYHPWKHVHEACMEYPVPVQRGSSSVYQPVTVSSLVIPPYSSYATAKVEESSSFNEYLTICAALNNLPEESRKPVIDSNIQTYAAKIAFEIGIEQNIVIGILDRKNKPLLYDAKSPMDLGYRFEEYQALKGKIKVPLSEYGDFIREGTILSDYNLPFVSNITLIHKIREIQVFTGYKRNYGANEICIKQPETNWFPAYQVYGEGIFIEFDQTSIDEWWKENEIIKQRTSIIVKNYFKSIFSKFTSYNITPKFLLLHTIAHLLMKELSFECGYNIASIKERIYCNDDDENQKNMSGIFLYTANGDSEGTLGGLVRQGRSDVFPEIIRKAFEGARFCSNDPVCSLSHGQGVHSLNLSSCYSCSLVPETSCEYFNSYLDRAQC